MKKSPNKSDYMKFARRLALMHAEAGELGLYITMNKIHLAIQEVGFEIEKKMEIKCRKT